ncbi:MAG TPA: cupredoxin domain-containing protein [Polyangiaceae bacterium]|jgi:plastocyanin domain-containing protein
MRALAVLLVLAACHKDPTSGRIAIRADEKGFTPSSVTLEQNKAATLVFTRTSDDTCAKEVVFPDLGVKKDLPLNKPVDVDVPTTAPRTLTFACGMNMFKGSVVVR